jgi:enamine deaminase RidA (YjgF/YER057c/UK114 family)
VSAERKLRELGIALGPVTPPVANYVNAVRTGNLLYLAGKGPAGGVTGIVGKDMTVEQAYGHARTVGLNLMAVMKHELGSLDRVKRIVKVLGMVNAVAGFGEQPKVINGCSDLFVEVFGERGKHARSAVGMGSLPNNIPVEIEVIVEIEARAGRSGGGAAPRSKVSKPGKKKRR